MPEVTEQIQIISTTEIEVLNQWAMCRLSLFFFSQGAWTILRIPIYINLCPCQPWIPCLWFSFLSLCSLWQMLCMCKGNIHVDTLQLCIL